jgi:hypothetical protein
MLFFEELAFVLGMYVIVEAVLLMTAVSVAGTGQAGGGVLQATRR